MTAGDKRKRPLHGRQRDSPKVRLAASLAPTRHPPTHALCLSSVVRPSRLQNSPPVRVSVLGVRDQASYMMLYRHKGEAGGRERDIERVHKEK